MSQPEIQHLPYIPPEDSSAHFDQHQFHDAKTKIVSADSEIAFSDAARMHPFKRTGWGRGLWVPPFASNTPQLRHVIAQRVWEYSCQCRRNKKGEGKKPIPADLVNDVDKLRALADEHFKRQWLLNPHHDRPERADHIQHVLRAGGYLQYITAIAYRSFALHMTSPEIAQEMGIRKATTVRIQIARLRDTARHLGYEVGREAKNSKGGERNLKHWRERQRPNVVKIKRTRTGVRIRFVYRPKLRKETNMKKSRFLNSDRVKKLYRELGSCSAVARRIGSTPTGVIRNLRRQGVKVGA